MCAANRQDITGRLTSEHACIAYLFRRRWPLGFKCPFCGSLQKEVAPAYSVVCRYCRKQTSITARTLMHGSKKDLAAWLQVAWLFCTWEQGLSARELQRQMRLSCYQTAWSWLQKIRMAAAMAEASPCRGLVLFDVVGLSAETAIRPKSPDIGLALEMGARKVEAARVRFQVLGGCDADELMAAVGRLVMKNSGLQLAAPWWSDCAGLSASYRMGEATAEQRLKGQAVLRQVEAWLQQVFCKAIDSGHLQSYLDEFSFHSNTAFWPDRQAVLDHLATALLLPTDGVPQGSAGIR